MAAGVKFGFFVALLVALGAYFYRRTQEEYLEKVLKGLLNEEAKVSVKPKARVAVGFGSCVDCYTDGLPLFEALDIQPPENTQHHNHIENIEHLKEAVAHFFRHGAAAERYIRNKTLFAHLVDKAREMPASRWPIGGNAPVMAARFAMEGCEVLLGARMSLETQKRLQKGLRVAGSPPETDDIHLLLEYSAGSNWGQYTAPRANRFIVHSDTSNAYLESLEDFVQEMKPFSPDLLVVGGLQMMDNFPFEEGEREARLGKLRDLLTSMPQSTPIHFEMASFAENDCVKHLMEYVIPYVDSLGMNEQELPNIYSQLKYGNVSLISNSNPRVATALDMMRAVYQILGKTKAENGKRPLTRLHMHTLAFQAILTTKGSSWMNTMSATAKASLTANRWTCGSSDINVAKSFLIMDESFSVSAKPGSRRIPFDVGTPVSCWDEDDYEVCVAPVLVCSQVSQTGGGGDNISAAGLVLQV